MSKFYYYSFLILNIYLRLILKFLLLNCFEICLIVFEFLNIRFLNFVINTIYILLF